MPLGMELGLSPGDFVLDGDPAPPQKGGGAHKFSAHVYFGQTAGWIKMALGMEVGLSPGDFVLDGDPAPSQKGGRAPSPIFGKFLCPNGWMHHNATWYGGRPQPRGLCSMGTQPYLPKRGRSPLPNFRPMSVVAKRLDGSRWHLAWGWALVQALVLDGEPAPLPQKGTQLPNFRPIFIVAKRLDESRWHLAWRWALVQATLF